ncbi:DEAD/DEAH box helicase [Sulfuriroseicoccus oceanibius]|nr:DEAD/DEAH box helicase [Sulfuriroseicoccus oceanibius]
MKSVIKFIGKILGKEEGASAPADKQTKPAAPETKTKSGNPGDWSPSDGPAPKKRPAKKKRSGNRPRNESGEVRRESQSRRRKPQGEKPADGGSKDDKPRSESPKSGSDERKPRRRSEGGDRRRGGRSGGGRGRERKEEKELTFAPDAPNPPHWEIADASAVELGEDNQFSALGLSDEVAKAVTAMGYVSPTEIQAKSIPIVLAGKDIIGASQTGTGKTAAFMLPIIDKLKSHGKLRCLVLEPTRELAAQVEDAIVNFGKFTDIRELVVHGGVGYGKQNEFLKRGVDIVVATPGRLLDHMNSGTISLDEIDYLVLDEVDRMLDMGFLPDVRRIVEKCSKDRQTLFFSATMPPQIESLASFALKEPEKVEVGRRFSPADTVAHAFYPVADEQRNELILAMLKKTDFHSVMIFTRTKAEADRIFDMIERDGNHKATVMHSDIRQSQRTQALQGFREGKFEIIVATDVAARGIDVSDVSHVINYRVPENPEDYVHRIGRTGRANKTGDAFTLLSGDELEYAEAVERFIGSKVERKKLEDFNYLYTAMLDDDVPSDPDALKKALGRNRRRGGGGRRRRR